MLVLFLILLFLLLLYWYIQLMAWAGEKQNCLLRYFLYALFTAVFSFAAVAALFIVFAGKAGNRK